MDDKKDEEQVTTDSTVDNTQAPVLDDEVTNDSMVSSGIDIVVTEDGEIAPAPPTPGMAIKPTPFEPTEDETDNTESSEPMSSAGIDNESRQEDISTEATVKPNNLPDLSEMDDEKPSGSHEQNPMAIPPKPPKKSNSPTAAIIVAILVALGLAGLTGFAFMQMQKKDKANNTQIPATQQAQKPEEKTVTPEDVDSAAKDVEERLNTTDDAKDLPTAESINDQTLGL